MKANLPLFLFAAICEEILIFGTRGQEF